MKRKPGIKFLLGILIFSFCLTGIIAAAPGTISGTVTNTSAVGIQNIYVKVYDPADSNNLLGSVYTNSSGNYTVAGLPAGNYKVYFSNNGLNYVSEWYNDKSSFALADLVAVTAGNPTSGIDAQLVLSAPGAIAGRVTNTLVGGIQNIRVAVYDLVNNLLDSALTDAGGNYTVAGLPAGNYKVYFDNNGLNYLTEWYNDKSSFALADQITVTVGSTTLNIDAQLNLLPPGTISGSVTNTLVSGIQNIRVAVYDLVNNLLDSALTDAGGNYSVAGLPAGNYKVYFDNNGLNYLSEWYNDKSNFATADQVTVTASSTTENIDAQLVTGGQISGLITTTSDVGIQNIYVKVYDPVNIINLLGSVYTDASGKYTVAGLPAGNYKVYFDNNGLNYLSEWYNDKSSFALADEVMVTVGSTRENINAQLALGGAISGRVTNTLVGGIQNIWVAVYDLTNTLLGSVYTDASGNYTVAGLPAGNYKVYFSNNGLNYVSEWYNDKSSFALAAQVTVTVGSTKSNIDAVLASGGTISGTVTNTSAVGIQGIKVDIRDLDNNNLDYGYTDASGIYSVDGLPAGNLKVFFDNNSQNYLEEWYDNKSSFALADQVMVTAGSTTGNINAQLVSSIPGSISGTVTDTSAVGISNIRVAVYDLTNNLLGSVFTDASGLYTVAGLSSGSFKVYFDNNGLNYLSEWYDDKSSFALADPVVVIAGSTTQNINAQLAPGCTISGTVTNTSAVGIQGIKVDIRDLANNNLGYGYTNASGFYSVTGLPAGNLKVFFDNNGQNYLEEWYHDKSSFALADQVTVTAGSTTGNINAQLASGGTISGRVTNTSAVGVKNIYVKVYDPADSNNLLGSVYTDASGNYTVAGLLAGNYKVYFSNNGQNYLSEWYQYKSSFATADPVTVIAGSITPNINTQLTNGIRVISPNGGENWTVGTLHDITWSLTATIASVNIDYSTNGGSSWTSVVANTANDGTYLWTIPVIATSANCLVRVSDAADNDLFDSSNAVFNILSYTVTSITVTSPNGGESWQAGTTHGITWSSTGLISDVKIEVSFNGGSLWSTIIASTPNDGAYSWDIVKVPSLNCFMRVSDVLGTSSDTSDAPFVLQSPPSLTNNYFILPVKWTDTMFGSDGWYVGDFNGDGRSDLMRYLLDGTRNEVLLSSGSAFAAGSNWITADHGADGWYVGDFNGDGLDDLMRYVPGVSGAQVFLSDGTKFNYAGSWTGAGNGSDGWYVGDYNGDGKDDLLRYYPGVSGGEVLLSNGSSFVESGSWTPAGNGADGWYVGDFNGDGRSDLMRYMPGVSGGEVFLSDGTQFVYNGSWTGAGNGGNGWYLGKFSGTERTDIMRYVLLLSGADVFLNTGTGFDYDGSWTPAGYGDNDWHIGDFNGDGREDLLRAIVGVTGADVLLSAVTSGGTSSAMSAVATKKVGNMKWLNDVPAEKPLSAEELTLLEGIKARMAAGEEVTIYQVQREYEMLTGKLLTRAGIMKLLKRQQWDSLYKLKAEDLLQ